MLSENDSSRHAAKPCTAYAHAKPQQNDRGVSALGVAVGFNRPALAKLLMDSGANLDARDRGGNTVLHYAAGVYARRVGGGGGECRGVWGSVMCTSFTQFNLQYLKTK